MRFEIISASKPLPEQGHDVGYLWEDEWDDWFKYQTQFYFVYFDSYGKKHEIGSIKIGQFSMSEDQRKPDLPRTFEKLDDQFFSLGQDVDYYVSLVTELGLDTTSAVLRALNDIALDKDLYGRAIKEDVTDISLLRSVSQHTVKGQYRRILQGGARLTSFDFTYVAPKIQSNVDVALSMTFNVTPETSPPTNIHVLIGRNGVGKSFILNAMVRALLFPGKDKAKDGMFVRAKVKNDIFSHTDDGETLNEQDSISESPFANILSITFSAFDDFSFINQSRDTPPEVRYDNVGLQKQENNDKGQVVTITRDPDELAEEFSVSAVLCEQKGKVERWKQALNFLEADPLFAEAGISSLANKENNLRDRAKKVYKKLSSGHKIVLLTITKLVEKLEEKTLVLIDEPESHLHPPLLSAFIRALSDLLIYRNGVAIIATHSPIVLQEVPCSCVWKISRHGQAQKAERPEIETFAENVGILTREVFGLEVTRSGFHKMLEEAIGDEINIKQVLAKFDNEVGSEGRALISSLIAARKSQGNE